MKEKNISNKIFKNIKPEKSVDLLLKNENKIKSNIIKDQFTGFVLLKKKYGKC